MIKDITLKVAANINATLAPKKVHRDPTINPDKSSPKPPDACSTP